MPSHQINFIVNWTWRALKEISIKYNYMCIFLNKHLASAKRQPFCSGLLTLSPEKFKWNFRYVNFKWILVIGGWHIFCEIALIWMSLDFTDDQSTLVQVMAWCRQATSHYLSQCWPRSLMPYSITRPQWVNLIWLGDAYNVNEHAKAYHNFSYILIATSVLSHYQFILSFTRLH